MSILSFFRKPRPVAATAPRWRRGVGLSVAAFSAGLSRVFGGSGDYLEALRNSPDRTRMTVRIEGAPLCGASRRQLSAIALALYDNGGWAAYAVDQIGLYSAGLIPQATTANEEANDAFESYWREWAKRCDFVGRPTHNLLAVQKEISQALDLFGDVGVLVTLENGWPQIQIIPGYQISTPDKPTGTVEDGVQKDAKGRLAGYWVESVDDNGKSTHRFIPAGQMFLARDVSAAPGLRGVSPFRRGANDMRDARDIMGFEKVATKFNASMPGVIEGGALDAAAGFDLSGSSNKLAPPGTSGATGEAKEDEEGTPGEQLLSRADLTGGDIPILPQGRSFKAVESNRPNAQFGEFMDSLIAQFAAGLGIPPSFFLDAKMTGPGWRAVIGKAQRKFDDRSAMIGQLVEWLWARVIGHGIANGELPAVEGWASVALQMPARITIDLGDEAAADQTSVSKGLLSRSGWAAKRQKDWKRDIANPLFAEDRHLIAKAQELAAATGISVEVILARHGFEFPKPAPAPGAASDTQK